MRPVGRVLVANRGEIALRIIRACHEEGLEAVAVYSSVDRGAQHVTEADVAVAIGGPTPAESYLDIDRLIAVAQSTGAELVHPGYGFLAERAEFADAVAAAGLVYVGPPASAIRAMGNKTEARRRMAEAGVPVVPGSDDTIDDPDEAQRVAQRMGYPVMVKAVSGGGGKGMRVVDRPEDLAGALRAAASEAEKAFGDSGVYLEKFIELPRHVEIQILADENRTIHSPLGCRFPRASGRHGPSCGGRCRSSWLSRSRDVRVSSGCGRLVLLPRNEYPDPGRASGHRDGLRGGSRSGAVAYRPWFTDVRSWRSG